MNKVGHLPKVALGCTVSKTSKIYIECLLNVLCSF